MLRKQIVFITFASCIGSVLEMYDFVIYIIMASVITKLFFPTSTVYIGLLQVFAIFAVGYLSRPIGGIIFGYISDRLGRQKGLIFSIIIMGVPIFLIGCLPTYHSIGSLAPLLLLILRFIMGISIGGEFPSGTAYLTEHAAPEYRGFVSSFLFFGINFGILLASLVGTLVTKYIPTSLLLDWGWRIPFLLGGLLAVLGFVIRTKMIESPIFLKYQKAKMLAKNPVLEMLYNESRQISRAFTIVCLMAAVIGIIFLFMPSYLNIYLKKPLATALFANTFNLLIFTITIPLFAWLSDLTSRNFILSIGAYLFLFLSIPLYNGLIYGAASEFFFCLISLGIMSGMIVGPIAATLAECFNNQHRVSGIGLSYNLSFGFVGGLAPLAVTYLLHITNIEYAPAFYLMMTALLSLIAIINLHDFTRSPVEEIEHELLRYTRKKL